MCSERRSAGMFWHNAAETWIDIEHRTSSRRVSSLSALLYHGLLQVGERYYCYITVE